jgi:hypothetical protein
MLMNGAERERRRRGRRRLDLAAAPRRDIFADADGTGWRRGSFEVERGKRAGAEKSERRPLLALSLRCPFGSKAARVVILCV